jgi:hypothetical protein
MFEPKYMNQKTSWTASCLIGEGKNTRKFKLSIPQAFLSSRKRKPVDDQFIFTYEFGWSEPERALEQKMKNTCQHSHSHE